MFINPLWASIPFSLSNVIVFMSIMIEVMDMPISDITVISGRLPAGNLLILH